LRPEAPVLGLDTAAAHCAVAVVAGERVIAARHEPMARGQAERLIPLVAAMLVEAGTGWGDLAGIGVGTGPGNFTGVRIAIAAARGMALARDLPAAGVSRFEAAAAGRAGRWLVVLPGRTGTVFVQAVRDGAADGPAAESAEAGFADAALLAECIGILDAAGVQPPLMPPVAGGAVVVPLPVLRVAEPDPAVAVARIAAARIAAAAVTRAGGPRPAPVYVRPPDAAPLADRGPRMLP
jgi:tRNA threonylcarbamoyl adenosine modification protein YeaZ